MAAPVIFISLDVSVESVGSSFPQVILNGYISVEVWVGPKVRTATVASPAESDTKIPERYVSPTTSTPEIPTAPILPAPSAIVAPPSEFPLAPVVFPPGIRILVRIIPYLDIHHQTPPMLIHLHHRDLFIYCLLGLHGVARLILVREMQVPAATVTSPIHYTRALVSSRADLLPPNKRFRDSISPKDIVEEDIDTNVLEDIEADATNVEVVVDWNVVAGIDVGIGMEVDVGIDVEDEVESSDRGTIEFGVDVDAGIYIPDGMLMPNAVERLEQVEEVLQNIHDYVIKIPLKRIKDIETAQRQLEAGQLIASGERVGLSDRTRSLERKNLKV
nr:hypothetical protein [Tanacetum cinerariifolium]